ncbi:hypothetical protein PAHAL_3G308700 [Panicum hallii]|jgi:hypothetical protein|uniref:Uncharacterized protein n=1 Tax=Panicum hallii TaxID=206008 RepID=A0A2S3HCQ8_9POAL|nr:NRR repressor homolog 1-like [Panicum hallii]PAN19937.1 hypothetical protein PAHAL_3G308700 [Panicum hallii]
MGEAAGEEAKKALRIAATDGDGASTRVSVAPAEQQCPPPLLPAAAAGVAGGGSVSVQRCGEDDDGDGDGEKVERFYALIANIRALRGLCSAGESGGGSAAGRGRKREREAEAPWRPAFRMEDFEEEVSQVTANARSAVKNRGATGGGGARLPAAARARAAAADHEEDEHEHEVAEARGKKLRRRVAAQG